jgi:hypothetical protein
VTSPLEEPISLLGLAFLGAISSSFEKKRDLPYTLMKIFEEFSQTPI